MDSNMSTLPPPQILLKARLRKSGEDVSKSPSRQGLRITVPHLEPRFDSGLGDPISMLPMTTLLLYASITQLPTPVINTGLFAPLLPHDHRVVSELNPPLVRPREAELRTVLNPGPERAHTMPLPPMETDTALLTGAVFYAPNLKKLYEFELVLGSGTFSTVVSARHGAEVVAVKIVNVPTDLKKASNFRLYICRELGLLSHLRHPSVAQLLDYSLTLSISQDDIDRVFRSPSEGLVGPATTKDFALDSRQYLFMRCCRGGNLFEWLSHNYKLQSRSTGFWELMERVVAECVCAVAYLHSELVVHRDIKLENVLLNAESDRESVVCTLTDFGLSKKLEAAGQLLTTKCGLQDYVSPELLMGLEYDGCLLDAWALGVLTYAIVENRLPFDAPPLEFQGNSRVSPSVLKRRRRRHNAAHRIAMIDWDWIQALALMEELPDARVHIHRLTLLVDALLVRKERRPLPTQLLDDPTFLWIRAVVPAGLT